jgi:glycosyltransferase involved in cell wall biosynthesis
MHNSSTVIRSTLNLWRGRLTSGVNEIILVENGSSDDTWELINELAINNEHIRFIKLQSPKGMGNALRKGIEASSGSRVLLSADDLPFEFDDLDQARLLSPIPCVVIGSKAHKQSTVERGLLRKTFTRGYRLARFIMLGSKIGDTQGTFLVEGDWLRSVAPQLDEEGFLFTTQLAVTAEAAKKEIKEVPVSLSVNHAPKPTTVRGSDVFDMGSGLIRLRKYKKVLQNQTVAVPA